MQTEPVLDQAELDARLAALEDSIEAINTRIARLAIALKVSLDTPDHVQQVIDRSAMPKDVVLLGLNLIQEPIQWLQSPKYLMTIMIVVTMWSSMGVGFLAMLAGILEINPELYEVGSLDGISNRFQEIIHITIPSMKTQMLFGAVMAIVATFQAGAMGVTLSGGNPTPQYAGQLIVNHVEDFGFLRYELGYAPALSVVLLLMVLFFSRVANRLFASND